MRAGFGRASLSHEEMQTSRRQPTRWIATVIVCALAIGCSSKHADTQTACPSLASACAATDLHCVPRWDDAIQAPTWCSSVAPNGVTAFDGVCDGWSVIKDMRTDYSIAYFYRSASRTLVGIAREQGGVAPPKCLGSDGTQWPLDCDPFVGGNGVRMTCAPADAGSD